MGKVRATERKGSPVLVMIGISTHTYMHLERERERDIGGGGCQQSPKALRNHITFFLKFVQITVLLQTLLNIPFPNENISNISGLPS